MSLKPHQPKKWSCRVSASYTTRVRDSGKRKILQKMPRVKYQGILGQETTSGLASMYYNIYGRVTGSTGKVSLAPVFLPPWAFAPSLPSWETTWKEGETWKKIKHSSNRKDSRASNKFRKSQIRKFADLLPQVHNISPHSHKYSI